MLLFVVKDLLCNFFLFLVHFFQRFKYSVIKVNKKQLLGNLAKVFNHLKDRVPKEDPYYEILNAGSVFQEIGRHVREVDKKEASLMYCIRRFIRTLSNRVTSDGSFVGLMKWIFSDVTSADIERIRCCYIFGNPPRGNNHDPIQMFSSTCCITSCTYTIYMYYHSFSVQRTRQHYLLISDAETDEVESKIKGRVAATTEDEQLELSFESALVWTAGQC